MPEQPFDIEHFRNGDRRAFQSVFDQFFKDLCLFANRFVRDLPAAEDIAQEAFITLWNNHATMESMLHIKSFLYTITRNAAINHLKHEKIKNEYLAQALQHLETTENFIHFVLEEEVERLLTKTQENLPPQCRQIFILAMQGKSVEDIAKELHLSTNTVKTQKKIAYRKLRSYITSLSVLLSLLAK